MEQEREGALDQEWSELLEEARLLLPGGEVLFAFLLTVPFSSRFGELVTANKVIYFAAFMASATATLLLLAPSVHHRLRWRQHDKEWQLRVANRLVILGAVLFSVAVASVVYLVTRLLYQDRLAALATCALVGLIAWVWFGMPLLLRRGRPADRTP